MYAGGVGNATARRYARAWSFMLSRLPVGRRWVTLEVPGRHTGKTTRFPLGMADVDEEWFLVSMLGECNWTRNVRAAGGRARLLRGGRSRPVLLLEVAVEQRPRVLKRYVEKVPGGRPHVAVDRHAPTEAFAAVAARHPVFRVQDEPS
jgi:hypothetical protein